MGRVVRRLVPLLAAVALLALGVAACGGGSGSSGATAESGSQSGATEAEGGSKTAQSKKASSPKQGGSDQSSGSGAGGGSAHAHEDFTPPHHHDSGGGAQQFRTKGGDNSIQEFGGEAESSEFEQAAAALHGFLDARAAEAWGVACEYMASGVTESLQQLAGGAQGAEGQGGAAKKVGCPRLLEAMSGGMPAYVKRDTAQADVGALRVEGDRAFLLFRGAHNTDYFMPMVKEGGEWKVAAIAASAMS